MRKIFTLLSLVFTLSASASNYTTPGTGLTITLIDLVNNSGGKVTFSNGEYFVSDSIIISSNDVLSITTDETVKFAAGSCLVVFGKFLANPPVGLLFTAQNTAAPFLGIRFDNSVGSSVNKLTLEYAGSMRFLDCSATITNCTFRYNTAITTNGNSAINLFRANPIITNCTFTENVRSAISGGANIANAPTIIGCTFTANNTSNGNLPQINLGASGTDTVKIIGNTIIGGNTRAGGIGFLPLGSLFVHVSGNLIKGNRYGISLQGGSDIHALVNYNRIEDNNIENNPNLGGSGIAFAGGAAGSQQSSIVTGNIFKNNLWGITIQNRAMPNLGNLLNADTTDDGKNQFIDNTNAGTPGIDLYNNTIDPIFAMGNYWNTNIESEVLSKIFDQLDNPALGLVTYANFILPVSLTSFNAQQVGKDVLLYWQTASEQNSSYFDIEASFDGVHFFSAGSVLAAGNSSGTKKYQFTHRQAASLAARLFYRIRLTDADAHSAYSSVKVVELHKTKNSLSTYPTLVKAGDLLHISLQDNAEKNIQLQFLSASGALLYRTEQALQPGQTGFNIQVPWSVGKGIIYIRCIGKLLDEVLNIMCQ